MLLLSRCEDLPLNQTEAQLLWGAVRKAIKCPDDHVSVQCVGENEIRSLNKQYRNKDKSTNVLTFSYGAEEEHDVALCMDVARREATERNIAIRDYAALLLVHAFLHVGGLDHDSSPEEAKRTQEYERTILEQCHFASQALSDVY